MNFLSKYLTDLPQVTIPDNVTPILMGTAAILAVSCLWMSYGRPKGTPPGPGFRLPLFGHVFSIGIDPTKDFKRLRERFGDIFSLYFGNRMVIIINGYEALQDAFAKNGDVFSDRPKGLFVIDKISNGMGLLSTSGDAWKEQRRFTLHTLRDFGMGRNILEEKINIESEIFLKTMRDKQGQKFDLKRLTETAVSNIICSIVFGKRFDYDNELFLNFLTRVEENVKSIGTTAALNFFSFAKYLPGDLFNFNRTLRNVAFVEEKLIQASIDEHVQNYDENNITDFISAYLREIKLKKSKDTSINFPNMKKTIGDLFVAGTETTSTTVRWAVLYLMLNPDVQEKCFKEILEHIGTERLPKMSDKLNLPYMEATITEVQRLGNIVPLSLWHSVPHDVKFRGYRFPKGVIVLPNLDSVMSDPKLFPEPGVFRPERFLDTDGKFVKPEEMIPFFLGKRNCVGESIAKMELFLFITGLIQTFRFNQPTDEPTPTTDANPGITFSPFPFKVCAVSRNP